MSYANRQCLCLLFQEPVREKKKPSLTDADCLCDRSLPDCLSSLIPRHDGGNGPRDDNRGDDGRVHAGPSAGDARSVPVVPPFVH